MKRVLKYATGQEIPLGAKYLCSMAETMTYEALRAPSKIMHGSVDGKIKENILVWHYYEVEKAIPEDTGPWVGGR